MKKIFTILAVLGALTFMAVPAQALLGMPDDQPGVDAVWWFLTDFNYPTSGVDTLAVFTNTDESNSVSYHYTVFTVDSHTVYDENITGSAGDIFALSGNTLLESMGKTSDAGLALQIDLDRDGTNDHWAGYVYMNQADWGGDTQGNVVIGQFLVVQLLAGQAAMSNIPMKEYVPNAVTTHGKMVGTANTISEGIGVELFSPAAKKSMEDLQIGAGYAAPFSFSLYPRFLVLDSGGQTYIIVWKSELDTALSLHVNIWNDDECKRSVNIPLPHELNFYDVARNLPPACFPTFPKEGWVNMRMPHSGSGVTGGVDQEWLAWTYITATGAASESWSGLAPVARDVNRENSIP
jgi:hypothetical protein